jgi:hypothetical protein
MKQPHPYAVLILAALAGAAVPASADWLITREGARVETQGAWTVKGKLVVFKTADGKLSSLRVADVDLDASRNATEEAVAASAQADAEPDRPAEAKRSVRVITDKDVRQAEPGSKATSGLGVQVDTWKQDGDPKDGHVVINGSVQNASDAPAADLQLKVMLFDQNGALIASSQAALGAKTLPPGERSIFRADFPGFFSFATLKFEPQSRRSEAVPEEKPASPPPAGED